VSEINETEVTEVTAEAEIVEAASEPAVVSEPLERKALGSAVGRTNSRPWRTVQG
jgi:hypothetical protein